MPVLDAVPALLRVFLVFVLIVFAIRRKFSLGNAFFFGSCAMGLLFGLAPSQMALSIVHSLTDAKTVSLAVIVSLILVLSRSMEAAGQMERLLHSFQGLIKTPKLNIVVFPAIIGLLPMPGGAIFSAPMVKSLGKTLRLSNAQLSYVNYWFRHIWEYWWPLYPGVLLTTTLAGLDLWLFVVFLFPLTVVAVIIGYWPVRTLTESPEERMQNNTAKPPLRPFLQEMVPILLVIVVGILLGNVLSALPGLTDISVSKELGLISALILSILWVWRVNGITNARRRNILFQRQLLSLFYMVAAILVFKGVLEDSHAVAAISRELLAWRIPLVPITILLPFLVGGVVGITIAVVGTTMPILIQLVHAAGESHHMLAYMMLALASGFAGVLLSPLHLCLLLSNEYFSTPLSHVYRHLYLPSLALALAAGMYFWVLHRFVAA